MPSWKVGRAVRAVAFDIFFGYIMLPMYVIPSTIWQTVDT